MLTMKINLHEILLSLSSAQQMTVPELSKHQQQVASLSLRIAREAKLPQNQRKEIYIAALIHDIGALSMREKLEIIDNTAENMDIHAIRGAKLIESFCPLQGPADLIRHHHVPWNHGKGAFHKGREVALGSHLIHMADCICLRLDPSRNVLSQAPEILEYAKENRGSLFHPDLVDVLLSAGRKEYLWLDINSNAHEGAGLTNGASETYFLSMEEMVQLSWVFSHIIDFRSKFTAKHSAGVAKTAERLAELAGFSPKECRMMLIAGYLHDLGKLAISDDVLEKPAKLTTDEYNEIRSHTYYTYRLLEPLDELKMINEWASFHHEKLNGKGYPFRIDANGLSLGARIMAVADIFTAITEDRPYRRPMEKAQTIAVLQKMVADNSIDGYIVGLLVNNIDEMHGLCLNEQKQAEKIYNDFLEID